MDSALAIPSDRTVTDATGAVVGFYEYGDPTGYPVLTFHGTPACGAGFAFADEPARARGLRIIAPDRPGVGRSSRRSGWVVGDYPTMVAAFADALGLGRFSVWGYSGGGPYAVACVARLAERIDASAVAAGMGEIGVFATADEFEKTDRQMLALAPRHPVIARWIMGFAGWMAERSPRSALKSFEAQLSASDRAVIAEVGDPAAVMAMFTRAFQRGAHGVVADYAALSRPWGCELSTATGAVTVWHGTADTMVPLRHSAELARRLPNATLTTWEGEGHLAPITHVDQILDTLRRAVKP
ncbi:MAG: alpha/beta fold hydrolase [Ilumatobacteraceae bacterium]